MIQDFSIETINNGKLIGDVNEAIRKAVANCRDRAMPIKGARTVTLTVALEPLGGNRERPVCQPGISVKLCEPNKPMQFVAVNVIKKTAMVENVEQELLFEDTGFAPVWCDVPTLESLHNGDVIAEINLGLAQLVENIADPDTPTKGRRTMVCKLAFSLAEDNDKRSKLICQPTITPKLQPRAIAPVAFHVQPLTTKAESALLYDERISMEVKTTHVS